MREHKGPSGWCPIHRLLGPRTLWGCTLVLSKLHVDALKQVFDLLESFPEDVRAWIMSQLHSPSLKPSTPSNRASTRLQRPSKSPSNELHEGTSNGLLKATSNGLQGAFEREGLEVAFSGFWTAFPRKQGKQEALRNYLKLQPEQLLQELILKAVLEQSTWDQWTKDEGRFIPLPSTWLHQRRWEDLKATSSGPSTPSFNATSHENRVGFRHPDT